MRAVREAAGLSLRELAAMSGVSFVTISRLERGEREGNISTLVAITDALGITIDEYVGHGAKEPEPPAEQLYVSYRDGKPVAYAYGEEWVAMALYMDDIGYPTPEEAKLAWINGHVDGIVRKER